MFMNLIFIYIKFNFLIHIKFKILSHTYILINSMCLIGDQYISGYIILNKCNFFKKLLFEGKF